MAELRLVARPLGPAVFRLGMLLLLLAVAASAPEGIRKCWALLLLGMLLERPRTLVLADGSDSPASPRMPKQEKKVANMSSTVVGFGHR